MTKTIIHVDLNSCFASCEQQDNLAWRDKPLGVVQDSGRRSIIIASSIEAKALGIGTGCPIYEARKICPQIILVPANFERYIKYSKLFRQVCESYSDQVEVFSIDELFIDVTYTGHLFAKKKMAGAIVIAQELKRRLRDEVGDYLRCSVGIAPNKMLAKLASSSQKPDGLVIVDPQKRLEFLDKHELWHICGIGERVQKRLNRMGIYTIKALRQVPGYFLKKQFGVMGETYANWARGIDYRPVALAGEVDPDKSYGNQVTLASEVAGKPEIMKVVLWLCWQVAARLRQKKVGAKVVGLVLRHKDNWGYAQKCSSVNETAYDLYRVAEYIYERKLNWRWPVRFVGVAATKIAPLSSTPLALLERKIKQQKFSRAWDKISQKYGVFCLRPAALVNLNLKQTNLNGFSKKF